MGHFSMKIMPLPGSDLGANQQAGDTVELQGYFRVADGYFAADHTSFWGCKVG